MALECACSCLTVGPHVHCFSFGNSLSICHRVDVGLTAKSWKTTTKPTFCVLLAVVFHHREAFLHFFNPGFAPESMQDYVPQLLRGVPQLCVRRCDHEVLAKCEQSLGYDTGVTPTT